MLRAAFHACRPFSCTWQHHRLQDVHAMAYSRFLILCTRVLLLRKLWMDIEHSPLRLFELAIFSKAMPFLPLLSTEATRKENIARRRHRRQIESAIVCMWYPNACKGYCRYRPQRSSHQLLLPHPFTKPKCCRCILRLPIHAW